MDVTIVVLALIIMGSSALTAYLVWDSKDKHKSIAILVLMLVMISASIIFGVAQVLNEYKNKKDIVYSIIDYNMKNKTNIDAVKLTKHIMMFDVGKEVDKK
jgi:hypothetical protein